MSQIIKIQNFDEVFVPSEPLSDSATIFTTYIKRSSQEVLLQPTTDNQYVYPEPVFLAKLYSNEINQVLDIVKSTFAAYATVQFVQDFTDTVRTSYTLTVTSESGLFTSKRRIVPIDLGAVSPDFTVHTINDNNFVDSKVAYYAEQPVTVDSTTLNVGIIEVTEFDNSTQYFNLDVKTSDASAVQTFIALNADTDPNGLNIHANVIDEFSVEEALVLDDNFVYVKLRSGPIIGGDYLYFKLVQSAAIPAVSTLDILKKELSNLYLHLFNRRTAVKIGNLTPEQIYQLEPNTDDNSVRLYLDTNNITWYDLSNGNNFNALIDEAGSTALYEYPVLFAYNSANLPTFTNDDVKDMGASIASALYDIFDALPTEKRISFTHTLNWLKYIKDRDYSHIVTPTLSESQRAEILSIAKSNYLAEFSHAYVLYNNVNKRWLEFFVRRIRYVREQISAGLLIYEADLAQIDVMLLALTNIKSASNSTSAFDQYTEASVDTFAMHLEYLKLKANTIQRIVL